MLGAFLETGSLWECFSLKGRRWQCQRMTNAVTHLSLFSRRTGKESVDAEDVREE